jgi:hypothetical protein
MKVNDSSLNQTAASQLGKAGGAQGVSSGGAKKSGGAHSNQTDQVQLSDFASRLTKAAGADSPERTAHIASLAADYKAGRYKPNVAATSHGIVSDAISK